MGLEGVEFLAEVEEALAIRIPDTDTGALRTPRLLVDYLEGRLWADPAGRERWPREDLERLIEGLLVKVCEHHQFTLDTEFRSIFP